MEEEKDLIELRMVEKMVPRQFYKYLKVFEKKKLKRVPTRKTWNHAVDLREGFVPKKKKIYPLLQLRNLSVGLGEEPYIEFTQENLMENSLQDLSLLIYFSPWSIL